MGHAAGMNATAETASGSTEKKRGRSRSLQQKAWLITAGVLLTLAALLAVGVDWVFRKNSRRLEQLWVAECVRRVETAQAAELDALERSAGDYAAWTDTYDYIGPTGDDAYVKTNLSSVMFETLKIDAFLIFDREGRLHTGRTYIDGESTEVGIGELGEGLGPYARDAAAGEQTSAKGLVRMGEQVLSFAGLPILRDDASGPPRGAVVHVRILSDARVAALRETLNLDLALKPGTAGRENAEGFSQEERSDRELLVRVPLHAVDSTEIGVWELALTREIHQQGIHARFVFYIVMCVLIVAATWVIGRLLRSMVIARLEALHAVVRKVGDTSDLSARVPVKGSDELAELTAGINRMFDALARSEEQRLAAEAEQERLNVQLQHAQKMEAIGTLTGGLAHDFNNLLTSIQGSASLIRLAGTMNPECERHLARVEQAAAHGAGLVRQMMAFGRRSPTVFAYARLGGVVRDALQLLRSSFPRGIEFGFVNEVEDDVVHADVAQLQQVLINLGTNSSHAMAGGEGKFGVRISSVRLPDPARAETAVAPAGDYLRVTVSDTGVGIAPHNLNRIFEPFFTTKPVGSGTGLGLAVVHGIIAHHRGTIAVESTEGVGTTFILHLPKAAAPADPILRSPPGGAPEQDHRASKPRVLLVDDDQMVRETLSAGLKRLGYDVVPASGGREALEVLRGGNEAIDLVVTDQMMPGMTGAELGRIVVAERPGLPLVLITGYASALNEKSVKALGFSTMLMKPVTMDVLDRTLRGVLGTTPVIG